VFDSAIDDGIERSAILHLLDDRIDGGGVWLGRLTGYQCHTRHGTGQP
jgi:hypothetical protein